MSGNLVSIIIPSFKAERFISKALESVRAQTYSNWEMIVVNDGPGSTPQIVSDFARTVPQNLSLIERADSHGLSAARNTGMELAKGDIVAFLDADDFWHPDHLETVCAIFDKGLADLVYSGCYVFQDTAAGEMELLPITTIEVTNPARDLFRRNFINPSSAAISRRLMKAVGGFDTNLRFCEDIDYWIRAATQDFKIVSTDKATCYYRKIPGSLSSASAKNAEGIARIYEKHCRCGILPEADILLMASGSHYAAGRLHWRKDPRAASRAFYRAWTLNKHYLKPIMAAGFTRCLSWLPSKLTRAFTDR